MATKLFKLHLIVLLSVLVSDVFSQDTKSNKFYIKGYVFGSDSLNPIPLANISNTNKGLRYISNRYGAFRIQVNENDTLEFSVLGYQIYTLPVAQYKDFTEQNPPLRIKLRSNVIKLKEINISANKRKQDSLARQAAKRLRTDPLLNNNYTSWSIYNASQGGVLSSILAGGNKKMMEYEKLQRLLELYHEQQEVDKRYNIDLVKRATGLDEERAKKFMKFCNLPSYFILNSNDYDVVLAIKNCYKDFQRVRR